MHKLLRKRHGQGTTEYIVILAVVVLFLIGYFWPRIRPRLESKTTDIGNAITQAK